MHRGGHVSSVYPRKAVAAVVDAAAAHQRRIICCTQTTPCRVLQAQQSLLRISFIEYFVFFTRTGSRLSSRLCERRTRARRSA